MREAASASTRTRSAIYGTPIPPRFLRSSRAPAVSSGRHAPHRHPGGRRPGSESGASFRCPSAWEPLRSRRNSIAATSRAGTSRSSAISAQAFNVQAAYVGSRGIRQTVNQNINAAGPGGGNNGRALFQKFGRISNITYHDRSARRRMTVCNCRLSSAVSARRCSACRTRSRRSIDLR